LIDVWSKDVANNRDWAQVVAPGRFARMSAFVRRQSDAECPELGAKLTSAVVVDTADNSQSACAEGEQLGLLWSTKGVPYRVGAVRNYRASPRGGMRGRKPTMDQPPCTDASAGIAKARSKSAANSSFTSDRERGK